MISLNLFSDDNEILINRNPVAMNFDWFRQFAINWKVIRSIKKHKQKEAFNILNNEREYFSGKKFRHQVVDEISDELKSNKCTHLKKDGSYSTCISLVSKYLFFKFPDQFVPFDSLSKEGLNKMRGSTRNGGLGYLYNPSYQDFYVAWSDMYESYQQRIEAQCANKVWQELGILLNLPEDLTHNSMFHRKVFDRILMSNAE